MILEGIVTTLGEADTVNIAPMGPCLEPPGLLAIGARFTLRPFKTARTHANLGIRGEGVLHVSDDVLLLARAAVGPVEPLPPMRPATVVQGRILADACRAYEFRIVAVDDREARATLVAEVVELHRLRDFFGFNRAMHAVLEAAILATRTSFLPLAQIEAEYQRLAPLVTKTGGPREKEAFAFLQQHIQAMRKQAPRVEPAMPRIVIIGSGISGLALAYRLEQQLPSAEVVVLEQQSRLGGTIDTVARDGFFVEAGPNGFLDSNPATLNLAQELGLQARLQPASEAASRNRFLLVDGRLRRLPTSFGSFLRSDLLGWVGKVELLLERFRPRGRAVRDESIAAFARRRAGRAISGLVDAFVTGILAGDANLLSMPASFPRLAAYEREFGSISAGRKHAEYQRQAREAEQRGEVPPPRPSLAGSLLALLRGNPQPKRTGRMWSFQGGLRTLVEALGAELRHSPIIGVQVKRLRRDARGFLVEADGRDSWNADCVVLTCPAYRQAELLSDLDSALADRIAGIAYNRVGVVALGYRLNQVPHSLEGFGYLSPQKERRDVLGVQWCSSIFPDRAPEGMVLLRAMCGGWHRGEMVDWTDARLVAAVRAELARALGIRTPPVFQHIVRWQRAIPQYLLGHLERVDWIDRRLTSQPGLFVGGNAYRGVAINDCVEQAGLVAERVVAWMRQRE